MTHTRFHNASFAVCCLLLTGMLSGWATPLRSTTHVFQLHTAPAGRGAGYFSGAGTTAKFVLLPYATLRTHSATPPAQQLNFAVRGAHEVTLPAKLYHEDDPATPQLNEAPRTERGYTEWTYRPQYGWNITRWRGRMQVRLQAAHGVVPAQRHTTFNIDKRKQIVLVARSWQQMNAAQFTRSGLDYCCKFTADIYRQVGLPYLPTDDVRSQYALAKVPDNGDGTLVFFAMRGHQLRGMRDLENVAHVAIKDGQQRINVNGYPNNGRYHYAIQGLYDGVSRYYARTVAFRSTVDLDDTTLVIPSATEPVVVERYSTNAQGQTIVCPYVVPAPALVSQTPHLASRQPLQAPPAHPIKAGSSS